MQQSAFPPPTSALPQLPISKIGTPSTTSESSRLPSASPILSKLALRTPSKITKPLPIPSASHAASSPSIPTLRSASTTSSLSKGGDTSPEKEVRRAVSIVNFPQPPKVRRMGIEIKYSSAAPSPIEETAPRRHSGEALKSSLRTKKLKPRSSADMLGQMYSGGSTPSLLNGSGDGKAVSSAGARESHDLAGQNSPPHSRSSSAQGSNSTSATTFEDSEEKRGRDEGDSSIVDGSKGRESGRKEKEGKGNVIVSVRVRPDAGGDKSSGKDWLVDGRQSLIGHRGREGGDYFYGKLCFPCNHFHGLLAH